MPTTRYSYDVDYPIDEIPPHPADDTLHVDLTEDEHNDQAIKDWNDPEYQKFLDLNDI